MPDRSAAAAKREMTTGFPRRDFVLASAANGAVAASHDDPGLAAGPPPLGASVRGLGQSYRTGMAHPMHLHGHHFQVLGIGDQAFESALRDTVMVRARQSVRIASDARNPGEWHCIGTSPITSKPG
jgi:hypothetical protein